MHTKYPIFQKKIPQFSRDSLAIGACILYMTIQQHSAQIVVTVPQIQYYH